MVKKTFWCLVNSLEHALTCSNLFVGRVLKGFSCRTLIVLTLLLIWPFSIMTSFCASLLTYMENTERRYNKPFHVLLMFLCSCPSYPIGDLSYPISYEQLLTKGWWHCSSCYLHEWKHPFRPKWNERMFLFIYLVFIHSSRCRMKAPIRWMIHSVFYLFILLCCAIPVLELHNLHIKSVILHDLNMVKA